MKNVLILLLFLIQTFALTAQNTAGISPMDVAKIQSVGQVILHEDGELAAYTVSVPADPMKENKPASYRLYVVNLENGVSVPMVTSGTVRNIAFRPGHPSITFLAKREGDENTRLYEISLNGGEAQALYTYKNSISGYRWSPDGRHIAFYANEDPSEEAAEKSEPALPYEPEIYEEGLSLSRAYVADVESEKIRAISVPGSISHLEWSDDGERMAIAAAPTSLVDDFYMKQVIHIVDAENLKVIQKIVHEGKLGDFAFSPNGKELAMIAAADINDPIAGRLLLAEDFGKAPKNLQPEYLGMFEEVMWSDNDELTYLASQGVHSVLGTIEPDGDDLEQIIAPGDEMIINSFARAGKGTIVFTASSARYPGELFVYHRGDEKPKRLTHLNQWMEEKQLGKQEMVSYKARDGQEIEGLVIYPLDYREGQRYPMITVVHGGPESHYDNGWLTAYSMPGQMAAAKGYVVFYPNYRGSTGRGEQFAKSSQGDLAGKEFDDIVDGVDYLIERGLVDGDKVGVTGGSYGGYATGWLSTKYTDRFAAGVMFVGISNNISKWGTSDIPEELYHVHARKRVYDDYQFFLERSPIFYADQTKTPLLIMAGKEDTRVHPGQSIELYRHIKTRTETPVRLILYPGEGHGNRNATARLDYSLRMLRWFDKYLKNDESVQLDTKLDVKGRDR
ncbi:S9 family peptidase [Flavilitoribacter nigricans]|uniref:Peptidase S9 n=1 Tax=Flavilitoribacter nigricans (strain ATCC 23147 / DSM 23189 / NBRC 102662 / NCIMB 1420 / SS-2) TaxID=1122177 RepID=A0A2D0ND10_FLAN2|nr:S9 family peptidase [Flavilitoribacter nigricans]PHN06260.1 peptidase S9 [Flavilitoribacter nigricans DSM 23189 = NBRC 102662]